MTDDDVRTVAMARARAALHALYLEVIDGPDVGRIEELSDGVISLGTAATNTLVLTDPTVSRFHAEVAMRRGRIVVTDPGSTNGTRIGPIVLRGGSAELDSGGVLVLGDTRVRIDVLDRDPEGDDFVAPFGDLWSTSPSMKQPLSDLARVAKTDVPVLLQGESGTGKELAARALHDRSARAERPFVTVDCGAIAPQLVASQLFGHERGAFTGADRRRIGAFEQAQRGTVFLDEVGELGPELQAMLLGVLERRRFQRVGGHETVSVDVRVVSATHRDLRAAVNSGAFRLDLYYRLASVRVALPPLRERVDDIQPLIRHFLTELAPGSPSSGQGSIPLEDLFEHQDLVAMERHAWPGNVRELRNVVAAAIALGRATPLDTFVSPSAMGTPPGSASMPPAALDDSALLALDFKAAKREVVERFERRYLEQLLGRVQGNVRAASRESRLERNHLTELLRRHQLLPNKG
jgi:DNA-binding NtrC family response regulator